MTIPALQVREMQHSDAALLIQYWLNADAAYLHTMGVDVKKMLTAPKWTTLLIEALTQPYSEKKACYIIWLLNGRPIGHCNVNKIIFGEEAYMHLHIWYAHERKLGLGTRFIKLSLPYFIDHLQLKKICCQPYALNVSPNKTLEKAGFTFIKHFITTPGMLNFEQPVNHWEVKRPGLLKS